MTSAGWGIGKRNRNQARSPAWPYSDCDPTRNGHASHRYAVFRHPGHVSEIRRVCNTIWSEWLPGARHEVSETPWFERYPAPFDAGTGMGGFEIWVPVHTA